MFDKGKTLIARPRHYRNLMPQARLMLALTLVFTVAIVGVLPTVRADDGDLDTTFDGDGRATTDFSGLGEQGRAIAIQADGKSVVAGFAFPEEEATPGVVAGAQDRDFAVTRYNTDGTPDNTFGTSSKVTIDFGFESFTSDDIAEAVAIQADGKIVVGGYASPDGRTFALARLNTDGSLDDGTGTDSTPADEFGEDGKVITFITGSSRIYDLAIQADGKIVAAGSAGTPTIGIRDVAGITAATGLDFALARYNTNGSLDDGTGTDTTPADNFDGDGVVTTTFTSDSNDEAYGVVLQGDGKIVAAGVSSDLPLANDFALARYNTDGSLDDGTGTDTTPADNFSGDGLVTTDFFGGDDQAQDVRLQTDGKIVAGGFAFNTAVEPGPNYDFALARYNTDGSLDDGTGTDTTPADSFGGDGLVTTDFIGTEDQGYGLAIQTDGKIILAGYTSVPIISSITAGSPDNDFALARYNTDGSLDDGTGTDTTPGDSFGGDGRVTTDFFGEDDQAQDVDLQTDGKIVAAGFAHNSEGDYLFAAARYINSIAADLSVEVTDAPDPVVASRNITYTIIVKNNGPANATNVLLVNRIPTSSNFISAMTSQGTCTNNDDPPIECQLGSLGAGEMATVTIKVQSLNVHNVIFNTSTVSADQTDPNPGNNEEIEKTTVLRTRKLSFSPATLTGGCQNSTGTLLLTSPAPPGGLTFNLSDDSTATDIPSTVFVPGEQISATFPVTTHMVNSITIVTVKAQDGDNFITGKMRLIPVYITSLSISPNPVEGGSNAIGTVTLFCAPEQAVLVKLSSNKGAAQPVQKQIIIPAGQTTGQFDVTTRHVPTPRNVTFTAVANGEGKRTVLHVVP